MEQRSKTRKKEHRSKTGNKEQRDKSRERSKTRRQGGWRSQWAPFKKNARNQADDTSRKWKKDGETKAKEVEVNCLQMGKKSTTIGNINKDQKRSQEEMKKGRDISEEGKGLRT